MSCINSLSFEQKCQQFKKQQQAVGLSLQYFKQKFVFNDNSGADQTYLSLTSLTPSQLTGLSPSQQSICLYLMSQLLFKAGEILSLPISTTIVSLTLSHYYYTKKSLLQTDFRELCMGAMFLACKSEETLRRSYQVAMVFDYLFKTYEGLKLVKTLQLNSNQYTYMRQKVLEMQNQILFQLGFQQHRLFDIPHRYISGLIASFNKHKRCNQIVQTAFTYLNDIYRTRASTLFPGQIIAATSIFMSLTKLQIPMADKPWWILMQSTLQQIHQIMFLTNQMYAMTNSNQVNINKVAEILENKGKQKFKIVNVFPVPYYRKINLQSLGSYKKVIVQQAHQVYPVHHAHQAHQSNRSYQLNQTHDKIQCTEQSTLSRQKFDSLQKRSKKDKKKSKKKHKDHRNDRSRSRSNEKQTKQQKSQKKGLYQNNDQTPKIRKQTQLCMHSQMSQKPTQLLSNPTAFSNPISKIPISSAKQMLSKISQHIKKIQIKNQVIIKQVQRKESDDSEQDEQVMRELLEIKRRNKERKNQAN